MQDHSTGPVPGNHRQTQESRQDAIVSEKWRTTRIRESNVVMSYYRVMW